MTPPRPHPPRRRPLAALLCAAALLLLAVPLAGCGDDDEFTSEGAAGDPIDLPFPVSARDSQVGPEAPSYYHVSGVPINTNIQISMTELLDDADLFVFFDSGFTNDFCASGNTGTANERCDETTAGGTDLWIIVKPGLTETGTGFLLSVQQL